MLADMAIQRMDNVAIVVDDLDAAVAFFTELGRESAAGHRTNPDRREDVALRDSSWPSSRLSTDHPSIAKSHTRPGRMTLSAAIEDVRPQCGRELCALARVNMSSTQEPSRSSDDDFPRAVVTSTPTGGSGSA
jgi:hypothetical protein